jgi:beta-glucoside operon transcriptional antiterminator
MLSGSFFLLGMVMRAIKKINNNVALCVDDNGKELIALGKGLGFPLMPYVIDDMSKVSMTFYHIDSRFNSLLLEIPEEIFEVSATIVNHAYRTLGCNLNPNIVVTLADHINFAITRLRKYKNLKMVFSYDVEHLYPKETQLGRDAVTLVRKRLNESLPDSEITNIAMHFINAEEENADEGETRDCEPLIEETAEIIEKAFSIKIDRTDFSYNRYAMHIRYYLKRIENEKKFSGGNKILISALKEKSPKVYECGKEVCDYLKSKTGIESNEDEILYISMHINRIVYKTRS